jgi:hypothetical protein
MKTIKPLFLVRNLSVLGSVGLLLCTIACGAAPVGSEAVDDPSLTESPGEEPVHEVDESDGSAPSLGLPPIGYVVLDGPGASGGGGGGGAAARGPAQ